MHLYIFIEACHSPEIWYIATYIPSVPYVFTNFISVQVCIHPSWMLWFSGSTGTSTVAMALTTGSKQKNKKLWNMLLGIKVNAKQPCLLIMHPHNILHMTIKTVKKKTQPCNWLVCMYFGIQDDNQYIHKCITASQQAAGVHLSFRLRIRDS